MSTTSELPADAESGVWAVEWRDILIAICLTLLSLSGISNGIIWVPLYG
jgi:hypothetical protein